MTPKEKADELMSKFYSNISGVNLDFISKHIKLFNQDSYFIRAKECSLIAVNEMEEVYASAVCAILKSKEKSELVKSRYLQEVKKEVEKL